MEDNTSGRPHERKSSKEDIDVAAGDAGFTKQLLQTSLEECMNLLGEEYWIA